MSSEKFYIQLLNNTSAIYLAHLTDEYKERLSSFLPLYRQIQQYHANHFHPKLLQCDCDTVAICDLLRATIGSADFEVYPLYSAFVTDAASLIAEYTRSKVS